MPKANAAIFYHPEGFETARPDLKGRHVAGAEFLKGFVRHAELDKIVGALTSQSLAQHFSRQVKAFGATAPVQALSIMDAPGLASIGALSLPGVNMGASAWLRRHGDQRGYSLIGLTHTISSDGAFDAMFEMFTAPLQPWDALVCTSRAAKAAAEVIMAEQADYLSSRFGAPVAPTLQLPLIPLGVDTEAYGAFAKHRIAARQRLGLADDEVAILFVGRLSFHAKAHPAPLIQAAALAAQRTKARPVVLFCGYFHDDNQKAVFAAQQAAFADQVRVLTVDGRDAALRADAWASGDIFAFLSDNIQESFGLAPLEAMAAGLPTVVSDWDGPRDLVRHGETGFLIPTRAPPPGAGADISARFLASVDTYDLYIGQTAMLAAVDVRAAADAFVALIDQPQLRAAMGQAGQSWARSTFDWRHVIAQHQELWAELAARRASGIESAPKVAGREACPTRPDPFRAFASYKSASISPRQRLSSTGRARPDTIGQLLAVKGMTAGRLALAPPEDLAAMLAVLAAGPAYAADVAAAIPPERRALAMRSLYWLAKFDFISLTDG